jgi:hypothetical protein
VGSLSRAPDETLLADAGLGHSRTIVTAARELFAQDGFAASDDKAILARAGVGPEASFGSFDRRDSSNRSISRWSASWRLRSARSRAAE